MKQIQPDIWETEVENPAKGLYTHAYLLLRDDGNVLFYNTSRIDEIERMAALGGVARQYLSHRDEAGDSLNMVAERFGADLGGHVRELEEFSRFAVPPSCSSGVKRTWATSRSSRHPDTAPEAPAST